MNDLFYMERVEEIAKKGRCLRRDIGCVLVDKEGNIISEGYNGTPHCLPSCKDEPCPDAHVPAGTAQAVHCYGIHSEIRAIMNCKDKDKIHALYSIKAPCIHCTVVLLETPCQEVVIKIMSNTTDANKKLWEKAGRIWRQI